MKLANRLQNATIMATLPVAASLIALTVPLCAAHAQAPAAQMTVLTPKQGETLGTKKFNVDVQFKSLSSSPIVSAELWVDGVRWVRSDLDSPRHASVQPFILDGSTLSAGPHTIVVKVLNAEGGVSSAKVSVIAGSDAGETQVMVGAPAVQFVAPNNGRKVGGSVELLVDAQSKTGTNPYVAFYVDNNFKTLKNYPPYSFVWDTTNETNGVHEITAAGSLDSSNAVTTRKIRVFVDNPGGNTVRRTGIPDLAPHKSVTPAAAIISAPTGQPRLAGAATATFLPGASLGLSVPVSPAAPTATPRLSVPHQPAFAASDKTMPAKSPAPAVRSLAANATPATDAAPTLSVTGTRAVESASEIAALTQITVASAPMSPATPRLARPVLSAMPARSAMVAAPHTNSVSLHFAALVAAPHSVAPAHPVSLAAPRVALRSGAVVTEHSVRSMTVPSVVRAKAIQVAFDGTRIAFDVAPRVEGGLPIAPFRQIFEHTGGKVSWQSDTKTMRAVNSDREVVIGVGSRTALVNGETVTMDRAAQIDRGRTLVPLNFVGKALDVDVKYDKATGRLSITSKTLKH